MKQMTAFLLAMIMIATPLNALSGATSDIVQQLAKDSASSGVLSADSSGLQGPSDVPDGVSGGDWNDILALYQEARYHLTWHGPSNGYVASNPDNGWHATFKEGGARVTATGSAWSWSISPTIYGYEGNMIHLNAAPSTVSGKNRISSAFSEDFTAWYINDEKGLEHGFDIAAPPEQGAGPLVINIALETGLEPAVYPGGICFLDGNGEVALDYSELLVTDSTGAELPSELSISSDCRTITISLDDSGAAYPITIDPLLTTPVKKLTASDGAPNDLFGASVAVSGDTIVVGAYGDDGGRGSAYVFTRNNGGADYWGQVEKLTATDGAASDLFGASVAVSGDTILVGAYGDDGSQGSAYVFTRNSGGADYWGQVKKLTAKDGTNNDLFGASVAISGDIIIVGAFGDDVVGSDQGSAYVFTRNNGSAENWGMIKKLTASDGGADDYFGASVSVSGDTVTVGAYGDDSGQGSVYVFTRNNGGADYWGQVKKLNAADGAADDWFGASVSVSGDTIVVGSYGDETGQGSAYVFMRNNGGADYWGQVKKLNAADAAVSDAFGASVSVSGDTIVIGAFSDDGGRGSAYVFTRNNGGTDYWGQVTRITASDRATDDYFGYSVSISFDTIVVGAFYGDVGANANQGSAYTFNQVGNTWVEIGHPVASDGAVGDWFGTSVAVSGDTIVVGASGDSVGANVSQGSAYVFTRNYGGADNWGQVKKITASDGEAGDNFGNTVSVSGDTIVVGASGDDVAGVDQGSAYVFTRNYGGADNWGQVKKLIAGDGEADDWFGSSVSISGETIVVGAVIDGVDGVDQGSAYVFTRNYGGTDNWGQVKRLTASDGAAFYYFGESVSVSGDTIVVGAGSNDLKGAAYVFTRNYGGADYWGQVKKLTASDGATNDLFGVSVSVSGDTIVVGACRDDVDEIDEGSAYVFTRNYGGADNWGQVKHIAAYDRSAGDYFGASVSVSGDTIVVGASNDFVGTNSYQGSAHVFTRNNGGADNWGLVTNITAGDGAANDYFGRDVSISGDTIVVGAHYDDVGANLDQGSAYIYHFDFIISSPTITTVDITAAIVDTLYSVDYDATDPNIQDVLTWSLATNAPWLNIVPSTGVLSGTPGSSNLGTYWVNVSVSDGNGGTDWTNFTLTVKLPPINLGVGWNLISIPLELANASVENVLASVSGMWDVVKYYDVTDVMDPWKTYRIGGTVNDLAFIDRTMGIWVHATDNCSLEVFGTIHASTDIVLHAGWNLVGYPTLTAQMVGLALWGTGADRVEVFDPVSPYIKEVGGTYLMKPGEGYWIRVPAETIWTIYW